MVENLMFIHLLRFCLVLLHVQLSLHFFVNLLPRLWCIIWASKSTKRVQSWAASLLFSGRQFRIQVSVLLHELYPIKESQNVNSESELSSQDFIQALRKMDLGDNLPEDLDEANFLFQTNHLPLSSFTSLLPSPRLKPGPSNPQSSIPVEEISPFGDAVSPPPSDPFWLPDDRLVSRATVSPTSQSTSFCPQQTTLLHSMSCASGVKNCSHSDALLAKSPDLSKNETEAVPGDRALHDADDVDELEQAEFSSDSLQVGSLTDELGAIPRCSFMAQASNFSGNSDSLTSTFPMNVRLTSRSNLSNLGLCSVSQSDFVRPAFVAVSSSSSDSEVDYRTDCNAPWKRSIPTALSNHWDGAGSSYSLSPRRFKEEPEQDLKTPMRGAAGSYRSSDLESCVSGRSERYLHDVDMLSRAKIPFSYEAIIQATTEELREMRASSQLTDDQIDILLDVRKRAANRIAAERSRRLKLATRNELVQQLASLRIERQLLQRQIARARQRRQRANDSLMAEQRRVLSLLRAPDGNHLKYTDWRVRLTSDDEIIVVAAGR